jgi:hypothetical protein
MKSCELLAQFADTILQRKYDNLLLSTTCSEDIAQNIDDMIVGYFV